MKSLLKLHIKFLLAMLMTLTMLVMLPACSSTSGGTAEEAPADSSASGFGKDCFDECSASCSAGDDDCVEACTQTCFP